MRRPSFLTRRSLKLLLALVLATVSPAQDLAHSKVGSNNDDHDYSQSGGLAAYAVATTFCKLGPLPVLQDNSNDQAPAIATNCGTLGLGCWGQASLEL